MSITIEKGIPFTPTETTDVSDLPFGQMQPGDSFFAPEHKRVRISKALPLMSVRYGKRFAARCVDGGTRVWCLSESAYNHLGCDKWVDEVNAGIRNAVEGYVGPWTTSELLSAMRIHNADTVKELSAPKLGRFLASGKCPWVVRRSLLDGRTRYSFSV